MSAVRLFDGAQQTADKPLSEYVAIVTGASRGIGACIAESLARDGACVVVNYLEQADEAVAVCDRIRDLGSPVFAHQADVADREQVKCMIDRIIDRYGRVDVVVNNAGILRDRSFKKMTGDEWDAVLQTNVTGVYNVCSAAVPHMMEQNTGCIVNISSVIGQTGNFGQANYSAAKAGVIGLTKSLALELARYSIRVNAICPGFVDTAMWQSIPGDVQEKILQKIPLARVCSPDEIADGVRYLIGASYVTGQSLNINGGLYMG